MSQHINPTPKQTDVDSLNSNFTRHNDGFGVKSPNNKTLFIGDDSAVTLWTPDTLQSFINNSVQTNWGTSLTFTYHNNTGHGLLLIGNYLYVLWFASTTEIGVLGVTITKIFYKTGSGSITFGYVNESGSDVTITRNNKSITVTTKSSNTITWLGST